MRPSRRSAAWQAVPSGRVTFDGLLAHLKAFPHQPYFILEERVWPHPELAELNPQVVHTIRIITALADDVEFVTAVLRIGVGNRAVDNFAKDNLSAPIDFVSGRLGSAVSSSPGAARLEVHPRTGARTEGRVVPAWAEVLKVVSAAALAAPVPAHRGLGRRHHSQRTVPAGSQRALAVRGRAAHGRPWSSRHRAGGSSGTARRSGPPWPQMIRREATRATHSGVARPSAPARVAGAGPCRRISGSRRVRIKEAGGASAGAP
jgi:hypothetical protein